MSGSFGICGIVILVPLFIFPAIPSLVLWYGLFISWYKVVMAFFLLSLTVYGGFMGLLSFSRIICAMFERDVRGDFISCPNSVIN